MLPIALGGTACVSSAVGTEPVAAQRLPTTATTRTATTPADDGGLTALPPMERFRIGGDVYGPVQDCRVQGAAVTCTASWDDPYQVDSYTGGFTGTLSGVEMSGTSTTTQTGRDPDDPDCRWEMDTSAPATYTLDPDGTAVVRQDAGTWRKTKSGSCSGTESGATEASTESGPVRWTALG